MKLIQEKPEGFLVISGDDMITLPMVLAGGSGVISVIGEGFPKQFSKMVQLGLQRKVDEAYEIHYQLSDAIDMILSDYARPSKWKAWSKEFNEYAQEELAERVILEKAEGDRGPISDPKIEKALKTKSEETGVPIGIIRIIMRRGMAAWKTGHRPGATEQQWGYARVNAFLTKGAGTWGDADKDVAKEVRDGGHDKGLKS